MKIESITPWIIKIKNFLPVEDFNGFYNYASSLSYEYKYLNEAYKYFISIYWPQQNTEIHFNILTFTFKSLLLLPKILKKIYWVDSVVNDYGSFMKLSNECFISKHLDKHSDFQCVFYFNNCTDNMGWKLHIINSWKEYVIEPEENTLIIFSWNVYHYVDEFLWAHRYSWSFGFSLNKEVNYNIFCDSLQRTLYK